MNENQAIRLTMRAHRAGIDASAQTTGGPRSGRWTVHLDHDRRIIEGARECEKEISQLRSHGARKQGPGRMHAFKGIP